MVDRQWEAVGESVAGDCEGEKERREDGEAVAKRGVAVAASAWEAVPEAVGGTAVRVADATSCAVVLGKGEEDKHWELEAVEWMLCPGSVVVGEGEGAWVMVGERLARVVEEVVSVAPAPAAARLGVGRTVLVGEGVAAGEAVESAVGEAEAPDAVKEAGAVALALEEALTPPAPVGEGECECGEEALPSGVKVAVVVGSAEAEALTEVELLAVALEEGVEVAEPAPVLELVPPPVAVAQAVAVAVCRAGVGVA